MYTVHFTNIKILWCGFAVFLMSTIVSIAVLCTRRNWTRRRYILLSGRAIVDAFLYVLVGFQVGLGTVVSSILLAAVSFAKVAIISSFVRVGTVNARANAVTLAAIQYQDFTGDVEEQIREARCSPEKTTPFAVSIILGLMCWIALWWTTGYFWVSAGTSVATYVRVNVFICFAFYLGFLFWEIQDVSYNCDGCLCPCEEYTMLRGYEYIFFMAITLLAWLGFVEVCFDPQRLLNSVSVPIGPF
jgi:hypothetical protein